MEGPGDIEWVPEESLAQRRSRKSHEIVMHWEKREDVDVIVQYTSTLCIVKLLFYCLLYFYCLVSFHSLVNYNFFMDF